MHIVTDYFTDVGLTIYMQERIDWLGYLVSEPYQWVVLSGGSLGVTPHPYHYNITLHNCNIWVTGVSSR